MAISGSHRRGAGRTALTIGIVAASVTLVAAACGSSSTGSSVGPASSITELDYYTDASGSAAWQQILTTCTKQTHVQIKRQSVPTDQLTQKILQGATSHSLPDLVFTDNPTLQEIAGTGALTPLTDYGISTSGYYDSIVKAGTYQGKVYGLAPGVNGLALIYNKDMLTAAGLTPPSTWDEMKTDVAKLTKGSTYGLAFSAVNSEEGTWQFLPFFWSNGADLSQLNSTKAVQANALYTIFSKLGLIDDYLDLILADSTATIPFAILVLRAFMVGIPKELSEAARVDGAGYWRTFGSIIVPVSRNAMVTAGLFSFLFAWADFLFAVTLTTGQTIEPITVGIYRFVGNQTADWNGIMATAVLASIPAAVLLVIAQRYVVAGVTGGAIKA